MLLNVARAQPIFFAENVLEQLESHYLDDYYYDSEGYGVKVKEGLSALYECIEYMKNMTPVGPLEYDRDLGYAARDHQKDAGLNGLTGHEGSSGLNTYDRIQINCEGRAMGLWAENLMFEFAKPVEILAFMLINDGDTGRAKRDLALDPTHTLVGMAYGAHVFKYFISVQVYGKEYIPDEDLDQMRNGKYQYIKGQDNIKAELGIVDYGSKYYDKEFSEEYYRKLNNPDEEDPNEFKHENYLIQNHINQV